MKVTSFILLGLIFFLCQVKGIHEKHRENGWYYIMEGHEDSLSQDPIVTVKEFAAVRLDSAGYPMKYQIVGTISKHRVGKWADATEKAIGKRIGFVFDDQLITDPQVNMRIESGNFAISDPYGHDLKTLFYQIRQEKIDSIENLFKSWDKDSVYYMLDKNQTDSIILEMDYWDVYAITKGFNVSQ